VDFLDEEFGDMEDGDGGMPPGMPPGMMGGPKGPAPSFGPVVKKVGLSLACVLGFFLASAFITSNESKFPRSIHSLFFDKSATLGDKYEYI